MHIGVHFKQSFTMGETKRRLLTDRNGACGYDRPERGVWGLQCTKY